MHIPSPSTQKNPLVCSLPSAVVPSPVFAPVSVSSPRYKQRWRSSLNVTHSPCTSTLVYALTLVCASTLVCTLTLGRASTLVCASTLVRASTLICASTLAYASMLICASTVPVHASTVLTRASTGLASASPGSCRISDSFARGVGGVVYSHEMRQKAILRQPHPLMRLQHVTYLYLALNPKSLHRRSLTLNTNP